MCVPIQNSSNAELQENTIGGNTIIKGCALAAHTQYTQF